MNTIPELKSAEQWANLLKIFDGPILFRGLPKDERDLIILSIQQIIDTTRAHYEAVGREKGLREAIEKCNLINVRSDDKSLAAGVRVGYESCKRAIEHAIHNPNGGKV